LRERCGERPKQTPQSCWKYLKVVTCSNYHNRPNHHPVCTNLHTLPLQPLHNMLVLKTSSFRIIVISLEVGEKHAVHHSLNTNIQVSALRLCFLINTSNPLRLLRKYSWKYVSKLPPTSPPKFSRGTKLTRLLTDNPVQRANPGLFVTLRRELCITLCGLR